MKRTFATLCATALLASAADPLAAARVEIVLDVSGSMRASAGDLTRMQAAQRAVRATVEAIDPGSNVALRLYGHRLPSEPKGPSCQDSELVIPFGPLDRQRFVAAVEAARPLGQTPLAYSLERAVEDFGDLGDEPAAVILVSDGEESCGGDPARVACAFRERGLELTVHTVGFDVGASAREQLQAVARCTGGEYRDARDAGELAESLRQLTQAGLLLDKQREQLGREVRGGDGFASAVPLAPGTYRLDHHQRPGEYDYFAVDVPAGHLLRVAQEAYEVGVVVGGTTFREGGPFSTAGVTLFRPDRARVGYKYVIKSGEQAEVAALVPAGGEGRYFVAIGNDFGHAGLHRGSPFTIELVDQTDAGSGTDAGDSASAAVPVGPGSHTGWIQRPFSGEKDVFAVAARAGATYELRVRPDRDDPLVALAVTDEDGVDLATATAPNPGAAVRLEGLVAPRDGRLYVAVADRRPDYMAGASPAAARAPFPYRFELVEVPPAAAGLAAAGDPAVTGGAPVGDAAGAAGGASAPSSRPGRRPGGGLACAVMLGFALAGAAAAAGVAFLLLRRRRVRVA